MRKRKLIIGIMIAVLFMGCEDTTGNNGKDVPQTRVIRIGETFTDKQISVKVSGVRLVNNEIIVVDMSITNNQPASIGYSSVWSWGSLKTPENTQLETLTYFGNNEISRFGGSNILPGATVQDSISFNRYAPTEGEYVFYANPPLPDDFTSEKIGDFQLKFYYNEIVIPALTAIEGRWYYDDSPWGNQTYTFNYNRYTFRNVATPSYNGIKQNNVNTKTGTFILENDKLILDGQEEYGISYILDGNILKLKYHYDSDYRDFVKQ